MQIKKIIDIFIKNNLTISIWGFGKTGESIYDFLLKKNPSLKINIIDKVYSENTFKKAKNSNGIFILENELNDYFLEKSDFIIPSPGIIINKNFKFYEKIICELDLFFIFINNFFKKNFIKIYAITGSVGKTSTTEITSNFLNYLNKENGNENFVHIFKGGNIGIPIFKILSNEIFNKEKKDNIFIFVLELSSAQLEHCKIFYSDYFIWTNFYSNHLDFHSNENDYFKAKKNIYSNSNKSLGIFSINLKNKIEENNLFFYFYDNFLDKNYNSLFKNSIFLNKENEFFINIENEINYICTFNKNINFKSNWLIAISLIYLSIKNNSILKEIFAKKISILNSIKHYLNNSENLSLSLEHRLENCGNINNIMIFNDSKSTIMESTIGAINSLKNIYPEKKITLILGGKSKGVNRLKYLLDINKNVYQIIFFGEEKNIFYEYAIKLNLNLLVADNLESSIKKALEVTEENNIILFSPGGSSFDLFSSYIDRGNSFKNFIKNLSL